MTDLSNPPTRRMPAVVVPVPRPSSERPPGLRRGEPSRGRTAPRLDLQGLRAVAVGLVVLYHLRPDKLGGGFIGVDVFFVISGFLIVGSLGREVARTGTVSLRDFYARRVRRLLPASSLVLVVVMAATAVLMPVSRWRGTAEGLFASVLQVQNWLQALNSGYATATTAASPLQHYWSLAVEEQFYVVAPLLLIGTCWLGRRVGRASTTLVVGVMVALAVASFVHSVTFSSSHHDIAYFATTTRMWELACGGLLALVGGRAALPAGVRRAAGWVGILAILGSAVALRTTMAFPGWVALVPVLGAVLVILGGQPDDRSAGGAAERTGLVQRVLSSRLFTFFGDISYSLYLWHWPLIVFFVFEVGRPPSAPEGGALVLATTALAFLTTRWVETPLRHPRPRRGARHTSGGARRGALRLATVLTAVSLVAGIAPWLYLEHRESGLGSQRLDAQHPGGASVLPEQLPAPSGVPVIPDPATATADTPISTSIDGCPVFDPRTMSPDTCVFGDASSPLTVTLAGDSHAAQFSTPLAEIADAQGWRLQTMVRNGCPFLAAPILMGGQPDYDCATANVITRDAILEAKPQVLVTSAMKPAEYRSALGWTWTSWRDQVKGYQDLWAPLVAAGIRVVVIRDAPTPSYVGPECVERHGPDSPKCSMTRAEADEEEDPLVAAASSLPGVRVVDLTDHLCNRRVCPGVVGNVLVYRDNHLTDTFALSLAPALSDALVDLV